MKRNVLIWMLLAAVTFCACTGNRVIDRSRVVTNPIDLDYEFTKGYGQQSYSDVDFNDPNLINAVPDEYKEVVAQLLKIPGALQSMIENLASTTERQPTLWLPFITTGTTCLYQSPMVTGVPTTCSIGRIYEPTCCPWTSMHPLAWCIMTNCIG